MQWLLRASGCAIKIDSTNRSSGVLSESSRRKQFVFALPSQDMAVSLYSGAYLPRGVTEHSYGSRGTPGCTHVNSDFLLGPFKFG